MVTIIPYDDSAELHWRHQANFPGPSMERVCQWKEEYIGIADGAEGNVNRLGYRPNPLIDQRYIEYRRGLLAHVA